MRVLVCYATRNGSTRGIAERIAARLADSGQDVRLLPVDQVDDLDAYDAVVLGSPCYNQLWLPEARAFVERNLDVLAARPVWLFSVGSFGDRRRLVGPMMHREPRDIDRLRNAIRPRDYRVFAGVIQRHQWPPLSRLLYRTFGGRFGDNRDWEDIDAWARSIG